MPGRNGMGPMGQGPGTGRGLGRCRGAGVDGSRGRRGFGPGRGRSLRASGAAVLADGDQDLELLRQSAVRLEGELELLRTRIGQIEKEEGR